MTTKPRKFFLFMPCASFLLTFAAWISLGMLLHLHHNYPGPGLRISDFGASMRWVQSEWFALVITLAVTNTLAAITGVGGLFGKRRKLAALGIMMALGPPVVVSLYIGLIKPPRPMYCNVYGLHHRGQMFPSWGPSYPPMRDELGRVGWADFIDDAILIVEPADLQGAGTWWMRPGILTTRLQSRHVDRHMVSVNWERRVLVVVRSDGQAQTFRISGSAAVRFYSETVIQQDSTLPNLFDAARKILHVDDHKRFDEFLKSSQMSNDG